MTQKNQSGEERILDHSYDGIQEYDNPLPRWWVWIFWATILFSVLYFFDFTGRLRGPGRIAEYETQIAEAALRWPAPATSADSATLAALAGDPAVVERGKAVYEANCAACHRPDLGGLIGPNLVDEYWLHGGTIADMRRTIAEGVLDKGMPNWAKMLKPEQIDAVAVYVASRSGSKPADPKPPQGERVPPAGSGGEGGGGR